MRKDRCAANLTSNFWLILIFGFASVARFLGGAAGVFCRMQNAERAIWSAVSVWGKVWRALARSEIDKDRTLLIGFQVYKSENNKVKWNKSRLPWLIWLRVRRVRHDCDMILAKLTFIAIAIGTWAELKVHRQKVIFLRLWTTRLKEQIKKKLTWKLCKISHDSSPSQMSRPGDESQLGDNHVTIMSDSSGSESNQSR